MAAKITVDGKRMADMGAKTVGELLGRLGVSREEALVKVDGHVRPEGFGIKKAKKVDVIRVVYGG